MLTAPAPEEPLSPVVMTYSGDNEPPPEEELGLCGKIFAWLGGFLFIIGIPAVPIILMIVGASLNSRRPDLARSMRKWVWIGIFSFALPLMLIVLCSLLSD